MHAPLVNEKSAKSITKMIANFAPEIVRKSYKSYGPLRIKSKDMPDHLDNNGLKTELHEHQGECYFGQWNHEAQDENKREGKGV